MPVFAKPKAMMVEKNSKKSYPVFRVYNHIHIDKTSVTHSTVIIKEMEDTWQGLKPLYQQLFCFVNLTQNKIIPCKFEERVVITKR